jgi:hypothetical protein
MSREAITESTRKTKSSEKFQAKTMGDKKGERLDGDQDKDSDSAFVIKCFFLTNLNQTIHSARFWANFSYPE